MSKEPKEIDEIYGYDELIAASAIFDVKPEVVAGALRLAGKTEMSKQEAETVIKVFLKREV